ncbi:pyridoxal phosphate-dependent aminotransferase [Chloroflexota bacterium]
MSLQPRPEVKKLKASIHGGINYAELKAAGFAPEDIHDFSVCTNPFMPPPGLKKALGTVAIDRYPDSESIELRQRLSEKLKITPDNILVGSGTTELIRLIALTYFSPGDRVLLLEPTFGDYEISCQIVGAELIKQQIRTEDGFTPDLKETVSLIRQHRAKGVFICNPNNPTGKYLSRQEIEAVLSAGENTLLILDEAYLAFTGNTWPAIDLIPQGNVVILRSMTKDYALAGLRLGYAIANQEIISNLRRVRPPWNVNAAAQKAGIIALDEAKHLNSSQIKIEEAKQFLIVELSKLGFRPLPSDTNFFLMRVGDVRGFRTALLKHGILVRDCTSFGLPEYVRIAPRPIPACRKLISALKMLKLTETDNRNMMIKSRLYL